MKGILMRPEMNLAIREDRKTVTRRCDKLKEINQNPDKWSVVTAIMGDGFDFYVMTNLSAVIRVKPRYQVGKTVYVKEAYKPIAYCYKDINETRVRFKLDGSEMKVNVTEQIKQSYYSKACASWDGNPRDDYRWRSPMMMPAWAARTFIQITDVRPERLQEITEDDARAEGCWFAYGAYQKATRCYPVFDVPVYKWLWDTINPAYPYKLNPWVFRYEFKRVERPQ